MGTLLSLFAVLVRLCRPSHGVHAAPRALRRDLREEAKASRVRRYANPLPARPSGPGYNPFASLVPVVDPSAVQPPASMIRPGFRRWEAAQETAYADRQRLGVAVALDIARVTTEVAA